MLLLQGTYQTSTAHSSTSTEATDPYATIFQDQTQLCKPADLDLDQVWDEIFSIPVCHHANSIKIKVMDREHIGVETVGTILISTDDIIDLIVSNDGTTQGAVHIMFQLFPVGNLK